MKRIKYLAFTICFTFLCLTVFSQNRTINGKIISSKDQTALAGATVTVKSTNVSVAAANDGSFSITAPQRTVTLSISSVNYTTKEVNVGPDENNIVINIDESNAQLTDVVVTALGI